MEPTTVQSEPAPAPHELFEPWLDKRGLAHHLVCSVRWIERRMEDGLPHRRIAGRAKFRLSEVEPWLEARGHIEPRGEVGA